MKTRFIWFLGIFMFCFFGGFGQSVITIDDPTSVAEGDVTTSQIDFMVSIDAYDLGADITVDYVISGGNEDGTTATLTFLAGTATLSQTVSVTTNGDTVVEADEPVTVTLSNPSANAVLASDNVGTSSFTNDDSEVAFSQATGSDAENVGGNLPVLFITGVVTNATTVTVTDAGTGVATNGTDYVFTSPQVVNIPASTYDGTVGTAIAIPTLSITGDTNVEGNETIDLTLGTAIGDATLGAQTTTTYTINNDDSVTVEFSQATGSDAENVGGNLPVLFITGTVVNATTVTVTDAGTGGATSGTDYVFTSPQVVNIPAAVYDGTLVTAIAIPTLAITGDTDVEGNETIDLTLGTATGDATLGAQTTTTYTINNDDRPTVSITNTTDGQENSGGVVTNGILTISQTNTTASNTDISYNITGTATSAVDFTPLSGTATIIAGQFSTTVIIPVLEDDIVERDETVIITLTGITSGDAELDSTPANRTATNTIVDDDTAVVTIADVSGLEDAGTITINAVLDNAVDGGFQVQINTSDGTGVPGFNATIADNDYNAITNQPLNFSGNVNELRTITLTVQDDDIIENDEGLTISMSNLVQLDGLPVDISDIATITIQNDDSCAAGVTAPILDATEETAFCDAFNKDLDDYTTSTAPVGSALTWSTNPDPLQDTDHIISVVNVAGTYYGFFYDAINDCASPTLEITITANTTTSPGTATNAAACSIPANGVSIIDLDDQLAGADAGNWSLVSAPAGSTTTIDGNNQVNFSGQPDGTYIFRYTTAGAVAPCVNQIEDLTITVSQCILPCNTGNTAPTLDSTQPIDFCDTINIDLNDYVTNTAPAGSSLTWSTNADPLQESAHRSSIVNAPGTYYGFFYDDVNDCASPTLEIQLTINITPTINSSVGGVRCGPGIVTLNASSNQTGASLNWYNVPTGGAILGTGSTFITPSINATTFFYVEAISNGCASARTEVIATVNDQPSAGTVTNATACNASANGGVTTVDLDDIISGQDAGNWIFTSGPSGGTPVIGGDNIVDFVGLPIGDYIFTYTTDTAASPCTNESIDVTISVLECVFDMDNDGLTDDEEVTIGTDPNNPDTDGDGILDGQEVNVDNTDPLDDCDSVGGIPLGTSDCDNDGLTNDEEVTISTDPNNPDTDGDGILDGQEVNVELTNPNNPDTDGDGLTDGEEILVIDDSSTTAVPDTVTDPLDPCDPFFTPDCNPDPIDLLIEKIVDNDSPLLGDNITFTISVTNLTMDRVIDITVSDVLDAGFIYVSDTATKGVYDEITGIWTIDELVAEEIVNLEITVTVVDSGTLQNTATLTNSFPVDETIENNEASVTVQPVVSPCSDCGTICNIFSPNQDGVNDFLILNCSNTYPNNSLQIFDRYGNNIFEAAPYDSSWDGTYKNGEVPKGTYFYILDLGDGSEVTKGWIQIIR